MSINTKIERLVYRAGPDTKSWRLKSLALLVLWLCVVIVLTIHHAVWRDEIRALSKALEGNDIPAMLKAIHSEGHPSVWYLLLRGFHAVIPIPQVIQIVSVAVAAAGFFLLIWRSPFCLPFIALILFSHFGVFEYSVMARNYGISMLIMFLFASFYDRHMNRGILLGSLLFVLANCNAHSVLLVDAFVLFWFLDILSMRAVNRGHAFRVLALNVIIVWVGIVACMLTIYPPTQDAAVINNAGGDVLRRTIQGVFLPAIQLNELAPNLAGLHEKLSSPDGNIALKILMSLLLFGSTLGLIRRPAAFFAALIALISFSVFFTFIYQGYYRHDALWLAFLISLYWIVGASNKKMLVPVSERREALIRATTTFGTALFVVLLILQLPSGLYQVSRIFHEGNPFSRSRDLGVLINAHPELHDAVIMADPDYLIEPLSFYVPNRTYVLRGQHFGKVSSFSSKSHLDLSLADVLDSARNVKKETGEPVIILLATRLDPSLPPQSRKESYDWIFSTTPEQIKTFQAATVRLESFAPASTDESYDVYVLQ